MTLNNESLKNRAEWEDKGYRLPQYDREAMIEKLAGMIADSCDVPAILGYHWLLLQNNASGKAIRWSSDRAQRHPFPNAPPNGAGVE